MQGTKPLKKLTVRVSPNLHKRLKVHAAVEESSVQAIVTCAIIKELQAQAQAKEAWR